ncbi:MAG: hypothetical protein KJI71_01115 [Patescibacteria group bacterium]|nr:hypothetical protein [Patescibacteria group bacterium]
MSFDKGERVNKYYRRVANKDKHEEKKIERGENRKMIPPSKKMGRGKTNS